MKNSSTSVRTSPGDELATKQDRGAGDLLGHLTVLAALELHRDLVDHLAGTARRGLSRS
jgi:hypothetical protein